MHNKQQQQQQYLPVDGCPRIITGTYLIAKNDGNDANSAP
jgi:hypothetical protein